MAYSTNPFSVATFGESYEQADASFVLTGVAGTGAIDTGIDVSSRTNVDLTGTQGDGAIGAPTPQAEAVLTSASVAATGTANTVTATGGAGVEDDIITDSLLIEGDEVVIDAEATFTLSGVAGTASTATVTLDCKAVVLPVGLQGTFTVGDETINAVQFDYESIKENYSRDRTAYIGEYSTLGNTAYVRAA
jgi:hypothetical protein